MPLTLDEMAKTKKVTTLDEMAEPRSVSSEFLEPVFNGDKAIEDLLPAEDASNLKKIISLSENPEKERDKLLNVIYFGNEYVKDPRAISIYVDDIIDKTNFNPAKAKPEERAFFGKIAESWRRGDAQVMADIAVYETAFEGRGDENEALATTRKLQLKQILDPIEGNFLADLVYSGVEIVPGMARGYWSAVPTAFGGMAIGALMAWGAGQVPPLTLAPEEIGTVPAGAIVGTKFGLMVGSATFWYKQGAGSMYAAMREKDYDAELSKHIAGVAAVPYAIVEFLQIAQLTPGMRQGALKVAQKSMLRVVANAAKKYGTTWSTEVFEEVVQEIIQIVAEDTAGFLSDKLKLPAGVSGFLINRGRRLWQTTKEAGKAMALLPIPGGTIDIYTGIRTITPEAVEKAKPPVEVAEKPPVPPPKPLEEIPTIEAEAVAPPTEVAVTPAEPPISEAIVPAEPTVAKSALTGELGTLKRPDGGVSTEISITVTDKRLNAGKPTNIPTLVRGQIDVDDLLAGKDVTKEQQEIAINRAVERVAEGQELPAYKTIEEAVKEAKARSLAKPEVAEKPVEVKKVKAPKELLGGLPVEPPGLTKAEVEHLGIREQEALRAAQAKGLKVGYKKGVAETTTDARRSLDAFRMKEAVSQKGKMDVASVVLTYVPKEKQGAYIKRILEAKTQKRIENLTEAIDKYLDKYEKRQAVREFKNSVKGIKKKYRRGEVALGYLPKKLSDKIIDILDKFDVAKISEKKEETLESRLKFVTRISNELSEGFEQLNAELDKDATDLLLMGTRRIDELKRLSQKYIGDLDVDEIKYIQASLEHLIKINDLKGKSKERRRIESLRTDINNARQEVLPAKAQIKALTGILGAVRWLGVEGQSTLRTLVGLATGRENPSTKKILIDELDNANNERKVLYKSFIDYFKKLVEKKQIDWKDVKGLTDLTEITIGGQKINIDYNNLLSLYAHTQAEGNLRRLLKTRGLNITIYFRDKNDIFTKKHIYRVGKPTLAELRAISEAVPDVYKKVLDVYFQSNYEKQSPAINKTSMEYQNYDLARQKKYFHVSREIERAVEGRRADLSISLDQQSRALPRTGGNARINIRPFSMEVMENMQWSAAYAAMTIPMENARTLVANHKFREAMKKTGQQNALKEMATMLRRTQGLITDQSVLELTASKLLGTVGKSILSLRFSGGLVQTASVPAAIEFIGKEYLSQIDIPTPADIKHLKEISPVLWIRWEGKQFDYALGMVGSQNAFESLLFEHKPLTDKFLAPYTVGDEIAITKLFVAAERKVEAETNLKRGTAEFEKASLDVLYEALTTQPQWDMLHRSPLTSDPSVLARSISMFMAARNAQYNVLVRAIDDYRKGRINKAQFSERLAGVGMANLLVSVARHTFKTAVKAGAIAALVAMGIRKPPDDEEIRAEAERLAKKIPTETVFNLIGLNALGTIFSSMGYTALKARKYGWQSGRYSDIRTGNMMADLTLDFMQLGIDFTMFTDQIITGEKYKSGKNKGRYKWEVTGTRLIDDITLLIAYRFGLPYEGIKSDIVWPVQAVLRERTTQTPQAIP